MVLGRVGGEKSLSSFPWDHLESGYKAESNSLGLGWGPRLYTAIKLLVRLVGTHALSSEGAGFEFGLQTDKPRLKFYCSLNKLCRLKLFTTQFFKLKMGISTW